MANNFVGIAPVTNHNDRHGIKESDTDEESVRSTASRRRLSFNIRRKRRSRQPRNDIVDIKEGDAGSILAITPSQKRQLSFLDLPPISIDDGGSNVGEKTSPRITDIEEGSEGCTLIGTPTKERKLSISDLPPNSIDSGGGSSVLKKMSPRIRDQYLRRNTRPPLSPTNMEEGDVDSILTEPSSDEESVRSTSCRRLSFKIRRKWKSHQPCDDILDIKGGDAGSTLATTPSADEESVRSTSSRRRLSFNIRRKKTNRQSCNDIVDIKEGDAGSILAITPSQKRQLSFLDLPPISIDDGGSNVGEKTSPRITDIEEGSEGCTLIGTPTKERNISISDLPPNSIDSGGGSSVLKKMSPRIRDQYLRRNTRPSLSPTNGKYQIIGNDDDNGRSSDEDEGETSEDESEDEDDKNEDDENNLVKTKKKLVDLEMMLDMCVLKLRPPDDYDLGASESLLISGAAGAMSKIMSKTRVGRGMSKAASKLRGGIRSVGSKANKLGHGATAMASKSVRRVSERVPLLGKSAQDGDKKPRPGKCVVILKLSSLLCKPCAMVIRKSWPNLRFRVSLCPVVLVLCWMFIRISLATFLWFLAPLVDLFMPYIALGLSFVTIVVQCWIISMPIASGIASLLSQLQGVIYFAFDEMLEMIPRNLTKLLKTFKVPNLIAVNLCKILFMPLKEALGTVKKLIPNVDKIFPSWMKEPKPLVPVIFVCLLTSLFFAQILVLMLMGTMIGTGDIEILVCIFLCIGLGEIGKNANKIVPILLGLVEFIVNRLVQYLLRKVLMVEHLQRAIDLTINALPNPVSFVKKRRKKKKKKSRKNKEKNKKEEIVVIAYANMSSTPPIKGNDPFSKQHTTIS